METTKKVAEFVVKVGFKDIPRESVAFAKQAFLDCVGVTLAGSISPPAKIMIGLAKENGGHPKAAVIGAGFRTSSPEAALVNGTSAHVLDYDDTNSSVAGHPSVFLVPPVMALGEELRISGTEALMAYIIGLEVAAKVGRGINKGHYEKGWHATATLGTLGAAAAGAKILKLNTDQVRMALGIAASEAAGLRQNFGTMTKPLHAGNASRNGVVAAILAKRGFTADESILEAEFGFCNLFSRDNQYDLEKITADMGRPFDAVTPGINLKPYPACRCTHSALDAMLALVKGDNIFAKDVESIEVRTHPMNTKVLIRSNPRSGFEGKFSMQFCMAIAVLDKEVGLGEFTDEKVLDARTQDLIKRVKMIPDPTLEDAAKSAKSEYLPSIVRVRMKSGKEFIKRIDFPRGHPDVPMSQEELLKKYRDCAGLVMSKEDVEQSLDMIRNMETIKDLSTLADLLVCMKQRSQ